MKREDDQELWDLLGHAPEPKISPFFARNVVRETRQLKTDGRRSEWLGLGRLLPISGLAVALVAAFFLRSQTPLVPSADLEFDVFANVTAQDYEVVADLDDLVASEENNLLEESVLL